MSILAFQIWKNLAISKDFHHYEYSETVIYGTQILHFPIIKAYFCGPN
jgi:hypothetical protein